MLEKALQGLGLGSADVHVKDLVGRVERIQEGRAVVEEEEAEKNVKKSLQESLAEGERRLDCLSETG